MECFSLTNCVRTPLSICPPSSRVSPICHSAEPYGQGNTRLSHIKRRRLIMPLVALVQKNHSAPATSYKFWCSALPSSSPLLLAFRHATSKCLYNNATNRQSNKKSTPSGVLFFLFKTTLTPKLSRCRCRSCQLPQQCRLKGLHSL